MGPAGTFQLVRNLLSPVQPGKKSKKKALMALGMMARIAAAAVLVFLFGNCIFPLADHIEYSTIITDNRGEVIHAYLTTDQQWRMKTELREISPLLRKVLIEKEDKYFYYHPGVNVMAICRAMAENLLHMKRTSGASTITMQVARALGSRKRTYWNKCVEILRACQLEYKYSKNEILQMYLNLVPYGGNLQGVKAASLFYFKKNPDHLSLAEIMSLSIIPNRPSSLVIGRNNGRIVEQRNKWLRKFAQDRLFTPKEIEDALREPLTASRGQVPRWIPHLAQTLKHTGGKVIQTHIDLNSQIKIEYLVKSYVNTLKEKNMRQAAVVVIDNLTHQVIAYIGSADFQDSMDGGQVNGAAAVRQPGSALKPLLYGMCIDQGLLTPKRMIEDIAVNYDGYAPENFDKKFSGYVTMEFALEHSLNIPAVRSLHALGKDKLIQKLSDCDFTQVKKDQHKLGLSMILGGCGATLEQMTGLYSAFANGGDYTRPSYWQFDTIHQKISLISPAACFMVTESLSNINRPDFPLTWQSTLHLPKIAWKTGTSYGRRDAWSIGYNKRFTIGVWVGNFSGVGIADLSGATVATPLLFKIFNTLDYDNDGEWFTQPSTCQTRAVCPETGLPPGEHCANSVTDYYIPAVSTAQKCNNLQQLIISADERMSYCKTCMPKNGYKKKWFTIISADMQHYYEQHYLVCQKCPPHNPACEKIFKDGGPMITSPSNHNEYFINRKYPEPLQLSCTTAGDVATVYWYINDKYYKTTAAGDKPFFLPDEGPLKISCTDDKGRNRDIRINVTYITL